MELLSQINLWHWLILGGALLILELLGAAGYLLWLGLAALSVAGLAMVIPMDWVGQWLLFSLLAVVPQLQQPAPKLLAQLQKSEQSAEPSADLLQAIGILLLRQREMEQAQAYLERAVALQPQATAYRALAELMEQQRLFEKANFYYRQSSTV